MSEDRLSLYPLHHQISFSCFLWIFCLGLFLFLSVHNLLISRYQVFASGKDENLTHYHPTLFSLLMNYSFFTADGLGTDV